MVGFSESEVRSGPPLWKALCDAIGQDCAGRVMDFLSASGLDVVRVCEGCGIRFIGRKHARWHSDACRMRVKRQGLK